MPSLFYRDLPYADRAYWDAAEELLQYLDPKIRLDER